MDVYDWLAIGYFMWNKQIFFFQRSILCFKPQNKWGNLHYANKPKVLYHLDHPTMGPVDSNGHTVSSPIEAYDMSLIG